MSITTTTHLNFRGQASEALHFYAQVFGGQVMAFTFAQAGDEQDTADGAVAEQIKWGGVSAPGGFSVMAFDVPPGRSYHPGTAAFYVSVRGTDTEEITGYWHALTVGGTVRADLAPAGYAPLYGMVTDRYGVTWVLDVVPPYSG
ncbi:VOC family protein [Ornithinimicrobium pratense]|uniref:VOC family protein n=1 Tax=Ornithinimicrobium pratense TaxID=2593973 RepID=A0A5J6V2R0_9MICO|nr:VOC family protein [Ornithinimicrobium pratense]QFG68200.1 VOC family protein [Ornithinimicrobium pratense]